MHPKTNFNAEELMDMEDSKLNKIAIQYRDGVDTNPLGRTYLNPVGKTGMALNFINELIRLGWKLNIQTELIDGEIQSSVSMSKRLSLNGRYDRAFKTETVSHRDLSKILTVIFILTFQHEVIYTWNTSDDKPDDKTYSLFTSGINPKTIGS